MPLGPNTQLTCWLLVADLSEWSPITVANGRDVHFYTVVPIHTSERDFELQHGTLALLQRMQQAGVDTTVVINRPSVA